MKFYINREYDGCSVRDFLKSGKGFSSRLFLSVKQCGKFLINGNIAYPYTKCNAGDLLEVIFPESHTKVVPQYMPLDILYEDDFFLAVNKPFFMPCHPSIGHFDDTLANYVKGYLGDSISAVHIPARIDMNTTGIVIIAKNEYVAGKLATAYKEGMVKKEYLCICHGETGESGTINAPIGRKEGSIIEREVSPSGKDAITNYRRILSKNGYSVLNAFPVTGRTHQIRVHFAHIGHPLLGDGLYGREDGIKRHFLHLKRLEFNHPEYGFKVIIEAPIPDDMMGYI